MGTGASFGVLGPVEAWAGDRRLPLGPPQQRTVLAVILLSEGAVTSVGELVEALWGDAPPAGAVKTVRTYVSRLRAVLGPAGTTIESLAGGYRLRVGAGLFDLACFRELTDPSLSVTSAADRAVRIRQALGILRGEPLGGLNGVWAATQRAHLSDRRAEACEELYAAELDAGHQARIVAEIPAVIRRFPFRERLRELQILALYRAGQRAEAFTAYRDVQEFLRSELGIDPMPALQELHSRMVRGDPALDVLEADDPKDSVADMRTAGGQARETRGPAPAPRDKRVLLAQLPAAPAAFIGRDSEVRCVADFVATTGPGPAVVLIAGMGGVGKTSLALHCAHRHASRYGDGQLYIDGYGPERDPLSAADVLDGFLQALGVAAADVPREFTARAAMFRSLMAHRRMLMLLDNAVTAGQVLDLLPGAGASLVIVTSRSTMPDLLIRTGATLLSLRPPDYDDALALFASRAGRGRVHAEQGAARDIVELSGRHPLALAVIAARVNARDRLPLSATAAELRAAHGTLAVFRMPDATVDVGTALSWSYRALPDRTADAFRLLCLHPGPDLNVEVAASMLARPVAETHTLLAELVAAALLTEHLPGRWIIHDLVRAYGHDAARAVDPPDDCRAAVHRMLDYYLYAAKAADSTLHERQLPIEPELPVAGVVGTEAAPAAWFRDEHPALLVALDFAGREGLPRHAWQLSWVVRGYLSRQGLWHHLQTSQQAGYAAALHGGEPAIVARALWGLAQTDTIMGRYSEALTRLRSARHIFESIGDTGAAEQTAIWMTGVYDQQGDWLAVLEVTRPLLEVYPPGTDHVQRARLLIAASWANAHLGRYTEAAAQAREVIGTAATLSPFWVADAWDTLAQVWAGLRDIDQAVSSYRRAVDIYCRHDAPVSAAESLRRLGDLLCREGQVAQARDAYRKALAVVAGAAGPRAAELSADLNESLAQVRQGTSRNPLQR